MRDAIESHPTFTKLLVYFKKGQAGIQVFFFAFFLQALTNGIKMQVIQHLLTLYVPIVTNINFLIAIDIDCQEMRL